MANDRNSGMNVPIPFRQIVSKQASVSDWAWGNLTSVNDVHIGKRTAFDEEPAPTTKAYLLTPPITFSPI